MTLNLIAEVKRAEFLDWINNNKDKIMEFLILEEEDLLINIYNHQKEWNVLKWNVVNVRTKQYVVLIYAIIVWKKKLI